VHVEGRLDDPAKGSDANEALPALRLKSQMSIANELRRITVILATPSTPNRLHRMFLDPIELICNSRRIGEQARFLLLAGAFCGVLFPARLVAQCPSGADPDALGCPVLPDKSSDPLDSPAEVSIQQLSAPPSPNPDNSTPASAVGSLSAGASHSEVTGASGGSGFVSGTALPPLPQTEFQRFVSATLGQELRVFGANLFTSMPASFGVMNYGPASGETIIGTGDELRIRIWGQVNFSADLRVSRQGEIYIPKVGAVHVAGLPFSAVAAHLREAVNRVYRNYELTVDIGAIHSIPIYVTGHARRPGEFTVSALSTLIDAIFSSGGPSADGSMRHVQLKRAGKVVADFDLYRLIVSGDKTGDMQLEAGDVLYIPVVSAQVALAGSVRQSSIFELRGMATIGNLVEIAGGMTAVATNAHLSLERIENHARRTVFTLAADDAGLATPLADGDIVRIDPILPDYRETVTLRGAVANPGRFRWHEGMRLSELMPERDALVKRDYWWRRAQLGLPAPEFASLAKSENAAPEATSLVATSASASSQDSPIAVGNADTETNWNNAVVERLDPATMTTTLLSFGVGKLVLEHDVSQDLALMPGDVVTIFSQADIQLPIHEQTKYVTLQGEFVHPGVYSVGPDETLRSVVARAGGLTSQAYLYAASFTRRSTQALEQQQLSEFADRLERQLLRGSVMPTVGMGVASRETAALNRELIARVRGVRATGRIVLDMKSDRAGHYELPDLHLENGDGIVVPFTPETVLVAGAVFNPHAFLFENDATVGRFLRLAGGPNRDADRKRILILRADGTVISRDLNASFFVRGLDSLTLHPGDSILVPEKKLKLSPMNLALLWTQALAQSSMSALEANALTR
jgi:protein involved in polysaccharide export with SLBB domain